MKKKLFLIALIGTIFSILIYIYTKNDEITLVAIGDGLAAGMTPYNIEGISFNDYLKEDFQDLHKLKRYYEYAKQDKTIKELIYEIKENVSFTYKDKKLDIQYAINEADILTIAIGIDELSKKELKKEIRDEFIDDIDELLSMIKMLNNKKVIVLGIYSKKTSDILNIDKINASIRDLCLLNKFIFLDPNSILNNNNYYLTDNNYYINYLGHQAIYKELKALI